MTLHIYSWSEAAQSNALICGGKGWNLGRLHQLGFPVPEGGVLDSCVYHQLIQQPKIVNLIKELKKFSSTQLNSEEAVALLSDIRHILRKSRLPNEFDSVLNQFLTATNLTSQPVAVRSSATLEDGEHCSFAGVHASFLNIHGISAIKSAIFDCFASLWTPRAVAYRRKMEIPDDEMSCAIVIMQLVPAQAAGVGFSCDPSSGRRDVTLINANFGLGEAVVSGEVEPDVYQLSSYRLQIKSSKVGSKRLFTAPANDGDTTLVNSTDKQCDKQVLNDNQIIALATLIQRTYWALGFPGDGSELHQDIEWAYDGTQFYLLQARPVTSLPRLTCEALKPYPELWSNGNFRDAAPMVQPVLWSSFALHHINSILRSPFDKMGYPLLEGVQFAKLVNGRVYCNIALLQWAYFDSLGISPASTNRSTGGHQPEIEVDLSQYKKPGHRWQRLRHSISMMKEISRYKKQMSKRIEQERQYAKQWLEADLSTRSNHELAEIMVEVDHRLEAFAYPYSLHSAMSSSLSVVIDILEKYLPGEGSVVAAALMAGEGEISSANHGYELQKLAKLAANDPHAKIFFESKPFCPNDWYALPESSSFREAFKHYLENYGHRAVYELDITIPRWREDPSYLLQIIRQSMHQVSSEKSAELEQKAEKARKKVKNAIPFYLRRVVYFFIKESIRGAGAREEGKSTYVQLFEPLHRLVKEVGRRLTEQSLLNDPKEVFHLAFIELLALLKEEWNGKGIKELIAYRQALKQRLEKQIPPDLIIGEQPHYMEPTLEDGGTTLLGMGAASGQATGKARLVSNPAEGDKLKMGDILVAPSTDPGWTPLFLSASAIVMETGGQLSHGVIVAREFGIPAVINIPGLFKAIQDGEEILVDGDRGKVILK